MVGLVYLEQELCKPKVARPSYAWTEAQLVHKLKHLLPDANCLNRLLLGGQAEVLRQPVHLVAHIEYIGFFIIGHLVPQPVVFLQLFTR